MLGQLKVWIAGSREPKPMPRMPETIEFVRIETAHGTSVRTPWNSGTLLHDNGQIHNDELSACRFARWPHLLFLFDGSDQCRDLQIRGSEWRAPVLALRVGQTNQPGRYFLCHPLNGKHLSAEPPDESGVGSLPINRLEVGPWELFDLRATPPFLPTRRQHSVAASLDALLTRTVRESLQDIVKTEAGLDEACLAAVAMQLPYSRIEEFSQAVLHDADLSRVFAAACPNDIWASRALPALTRHQGSATREDRRTLSIGTDLDRLATAGFEGDYCSFGHLCNALARRTVLPARRVCVLATCRRPHPKRREANGSAFSPHPRAEFAWINHYIMKSAEEFILRRSNPRGDGPASSMLPLDVFTHTHVRWFRDFYESADGTQDNRIRDCCPGFDAEYNRLKSLPGVIRACGLIAAAMAKRRAELLDLLRGSDRFSVAGSDEEWFGSLLLERQFAG